LFPTPLVPTPLVPINWSWITLSVFHFFVTSPRKYYRKYRSEYSANKMYHVIYPKGIWMLRSDINMITSARCNIVHETMNSTVTMKDTNNNHDS
jgi:hypothetical protein